MQTECTSKQLSFERFGRREVAGCFDGGWMTSDGGALLLREADRLFDVSGRLAECFDDYRDPDHRAQNPAVVRVGVPLAEHVPDRPRQLARRNAARSARVDPLRRPPLAGAELDAAPRYAPIRPKDRTNARKGAAHAQPPTQEKSPGKRRNDAPNPSGNRRRVPIAPRASGNRPQQSAGEICGLAFR